MSLNYIENQIKKIACSLGILQGLAYAILALICIILYNRGTPYIPLDSYMQTVNYVLYTLYLGPDIRAFEDQALTPYVFSGFVWVYFILHIIWIGCSIDALRQKGLKLQKYLKLWSYLTFFISLWDFLVVVILGSDYTKCLSFADKYFWSIQDKIANQEICANGILTVLVIAARGFILWIVNVVFAAVIFNMSRRLNTRVQQPVNVPPIGYLVQYPSGQPLPPSQPIPGQPLTDQPLTGQPLTGQLLTGHPLTGQAIPGQPLTGQPLPGQPLPGQPQLPTGSLSPPLYLQYTVPIPEPDYDLPSSFPTKQFR